ncbi:MAG: class I SAM-dependent methyltransferase [Stellaceae bacterium]
MASALDKLAFEAGQAARIGWFSGQKMLARRLTRPMPVPERLRGRPVPDRRRLLADLWRLLEQDWRNIESGLYLPPDDWRGNPLDAVRRAVDFFADLRAVDALRHGERAGRRLDPPEDGCYPPYYLQKFHFQSDGYLSAASAERYDYQVEILFGGGAAAMRRQVLVPLRQALTHNPGGAARARLLDIGCGTGMLLREVKRNHPRLAVTGIDLSAPYLDVARRRLADWSGVELLAAPAEAMPLPDAGFDIVTCVYLMHELPPAVRGAVAAEIRRVLKPGGTLILVDSVQLGDEPDYDAMLEWFPVAFHEPYYAGYLRADLDRLMGVDLVPVDRTTAYFSKVLTYRRNPLMGHNI